MSFIKDRNLRFSILLWLFLSVPFGISLNLIQQSYQNLKYLLRAGEVGFGTYKPVPGFPEHHTLFLRDGREILSVYVEKLGKLELGKEYQLIYVSIGKLVVSVELYPFDKLFVFRFVRNYIWALLFLVVAAFFAAYRLSVI